LELMTLISSAHAEMQAESIMADANIAAVILACGIGVIARLPDLNRETLLQGVYVGAARGNRGLGIDQACDRIRVAAPAPPTAPARPW
jgi:hypothetical protein